MKRRGFVKLCATAAASVGANADLLAQPGGQINTYERVLLVDAEGTPVKTPQPVGCGVLPGICHSC